MTGSLLKFKVFIFCKAVLISADGFITATFLVATDITFNSLRLVDGFFVIVQRISLEVIIPTSFLPSVTNKLLTLPFTNSFAQSYKLALGFTEIKLRVITSPTATILIKF